MALTLHEAFVPSCQQVLGGMQALVNKAEAFVQEQGLTDADLIEAKLCDTMWPLPQHVRSVWVHSAYVISQLPTGEFSPDFTELPQSWDAMRAQLKAAQDALAAERRLDIVTFRDWQQIEAAEVAAAREGSPREKFVDVTAMLATRM